MLEKTRDNEIHVEMVEAPPAKSIAFGIERLGLIPMKAPIISCSMKRHPHPDFSRA